MPPGQMRFRTDLEGFRGIAIVLVVLFHAGALAGGFVGVDLFFVLSGFFITAGLARELEATGRIDLNEFWGRRVLRLSPPLLLVLVATLAIALTLYAPIDRADVAGFARYAAMYAGNIDLAARSRDYFSSTDNPLLHTWSLGVEEQFYLVWPLLLAIPGLLVASTADSARQRYRALLLTIVVAGAASLIASIVITPESQPWAFYGVLTRVWEFALGGFIALSVPDNTDATDGPAMTLQLIGVAMIGAAIAKFDEGTPYPGYAALLPALGAVMLVIGGMRAPDSTISRLLSREPLRWLGRVSYAWYLWHWPLVGLGVVLHPDLGTPGKLAWSLGALLPAWLTYRYVEGSARDGRLSRIAPERLALYGVAASGAAVLVAYGAMKLGEAQAASPAQARFAAARSDRFAKSCWANTLDEWRPCFAGDLRSGTTIMLLGDSHAEHWMGALDRAGKERGWKIDAMVKGGCPVSDAPEMTHPRRIRHYRECARFREAMLQRMIRERPAAVILSSWDHYIARNGRSSSWQVTPAQWEAGLRRTYERLTKAGLRVIVMRDVPQVPFDVPQCFSRRAAGLPFAQPCTYDGDKALHRTGVAAQNRAARGLPISFIDMNDAICRSPRCTPARNGHVVFTDDNHITASFSRSVGGSLAQRIAPVIAH